MLSGVELLLCTSVFKRKTNYLEVAMDRFRGSNSRSEWCVYGGSGVPLPTMTSLSYTNPQSSSNHYHPYLKDGEGTVFTCVSLCTPGGGGTAVPGSFPGLWSQVLSWRGGTPVPFSLPGLWSKILSGGNPRPKVLSQVSGPRSFPGGYSAGTGVPSFPRDRTAE